MGFRPFRDQKPPSDSGRFTPHHQLVVEPSSTQRRMERARPPIGDRLSDGGEGAQVAGQLGNHQIDECTRVLLEAVAELQHRLCGSYDRENR